MRGGAHLAHERARDEEEDQADVRDVGGRVGRQAEQGAAVVLEGARSRRTAALVGRGRHVRHLSRAPRASGMVSADILLRALRRE